MSIPMHNIMHIKLSTSRVNQHLVWKYWYSFNLFNSSIDFYTGPESKIFAQHTEQY